MKAGTLLTNLAVLITTGSCTYYEGFQDMLKSVNSARAAQGLRPMCNSAKLMNAAKKHSEIQANKLEMTHTVIGSDGNPESLGKRFKDAGFAFQSTAENVAQTPSLDVKAVMDSWIKSPGHQANIVGEYTHFGSGVMKGKDNKYYWTQHFAKGGSDEQCMDGNSSLSPAPEPYGKPSQDLANKFNDEDENKANSPPQPAKVPEAKVVNKGMPTEPMPNASYSDDIGSLPPKQVSKKINAPQSPEQIASNEDDLNSVESDGKNPSSGDQTKNICLNGRCYDVSVGPDGQWVHAALVPGNANY